MLDFLNKRFISLAALVLVGLGVAFGLPGVWVPGLIIFIVDCL